MARKKKLPPLPPFGEVLHGRFGGVQDGPYDRWVDGKHLGPYSPRHVPLRTLKFMREHPQVALGLAAYRGPFFGVDLELSGGTPATRAFVQKTFLETALKDRVLETILNAIDFGFQPHEIIYDQEDVTFDEDGAGPGAPKTISLATVITEINDIDPERVTPVVDDRDRLLGYRIDGRELQTIPVEKALHAVHSMEYRNWRGRSILRKSYKPWYFEEFLLLFSQRYFERKADPPYHGVAPAEPRPDPRDPTKNVWPVQVLRDQLLDLRASGAIVTPNEPDAKGQQKWSIRELTDGGRAGEYVTKLTYLDALILRGLLVPEEITTRGSVGSQAKTETVHGVFLQALEFAKNTLVLRTINKGIIEPLVRYNFGNESAPIADAPEFNGETKAFLEELLKLCLTIPQELATGEVYRPMDQIVWDRVLQKVSAPYRKAAEVAKKPAAAPSSAGSPATGTPTGTPTGEPPADEDEGTA